MQEYVDHTIFERHSELGGTWLVNTYPGVQCDVPSHIYVLPPSHSQTLIICDRSLAAGIPFRSQSRLVALLRQRRGDRSIHRAHCEEMEPGPRRQTQPRSERGPLAGRPRPVAADGRTRRTGVARVRRRAAVRARRAHVRTPLQHTLYPYIC